MTGLKMFIHASTFPTQNHEAHFVNHYKFDAPGIQGFEGVHWLRRLKSDPPDFTNPWGL
jgi:hypothetical protein